MCSISVPSPPPPAALKRGVEAMDKAKAAGAKTDRERDYIAAADLFFKDSDKLDHRTRAAAYAKAMEQLYQRYPQDREAAIFYALALQATAEILFTLESQARSVVGHHDFAALTNDIVTVVDIGDTNVQFAVDRQSGVGEHRGAGKGGTDGNC
mgnify:CR=1 FL=1